MARTRAARRRPPSPPLPLPRPDDDWRIDDRTRDIGRRGVQAARDALARATRKTQRER